MILEYVKKLGHGKYIIRKIDGSEYDITTRKTNKIVAIKPTEIVKKHTTKDIIISENWLQRNFTINNQYEYVFLDNDILDIIIDKKNFLNTLIFDNIKIAETLHNIDNIVIYTSDTNDEKYIVCKEIMNKEFNKLDIKIHRIK